MSSKELESDTEIVKNLMSNYTKNQLKIGRYRCCAQIARKTNDIEPFFIRCSEHCPISLVLYDCNKKRIRLCKDHYEIYKSCENIPENIKIII